MRRWTARMMSVERSMPVLHAAGEKASSTSSICARTSDAGKGRMAEMELGLWAVMQVTTVVPCTPKEANVFRSACTPAPPPLSEPAIVSATGCPRCVDISILLRASQPFRSISRFLPQKESFLCSMLSYFHSMNKDQVAELLVEIGILLELKGENPFKSRAYANAARALEGLTEPIDKLISENRLGEVKGIGDAIQKKITELITTGKLPYYEQLKQSF